MWFFIHINILIIFRDLKEYLNFSLLKYFIKLCQLFNLLNRNRNFNNLQQVYYVQY
jgi:hypothetical protein